MRRSPEAARSSLRNATACRPDATHLLLISFRHIHRCARIRSWSVSLPNFSTAVNALLLGCVCALSACDSRSSGTVPDANISATTQVSQSRELRERQIAFLNRIRDADPQGRTIDRALLNEQNELGLVLDRSVEMDKIPALMKTMLTQMAREFPAEDLKVLAYAPSNPPRKIGTAWLDARSRDMTYAPER